MVTGKNRIATSVMFLNYVYCHSFASLEGRFEKGVILSNPFSIDSGGISDMDKTEILRASYEALILGIKVMKCC
ncbi:MAG: hypothetical protein E3J78_06195 [Candidatus Cloacimonadota bacterium]|nr:MAG: hypothetical protein E3J78_06195 [Candidatus Cloacimonadota bacterium]